MIYLSGAIPSAMLAHPRRDLGVMYTPGMGNVIPFAWLPWAADNGCFAKGESFDAGNWLEWLASTRKGKETCLFAVAPDVLANASATIERSRAFLPTIRQLGFPAAFVLQDGAEYTQLEWDSFDCLFIGGTTTFKLSEVAYRFSAEAKTRGKWVHMGRVNSLKRLKACKVADIDSADGTFVRFGPDRNLPIVYDWLDAINGPQTTLSEAL